MLRPDQEFADHAEALYRSEQESRVAQFETKQILYNEHSLDIPPGLTLRAREFKSGIGLEKVERAKTLLVDGRAPQFNAYAEGGSRRSEGGTRRLLSDQARVSEWITGAKTTANRNSDRDMFAALAEDVLVESRAYELYLPVPELWQTEDEVENSIEEILDKLDDEEEQQVRDRERTRRSKRREHDLYKKRVFPISIELLPAASTIARWTPKGLTEVWSYQKKLVLDVLDYYRDADGNCLAQNLEEYVDTKKLTLHSVCTVVTRCDDEHIQIGVLPFELDDEWHTVSEVQEWGGLDMLYSDVHGLDEVPVAYYPGRQTNAARPDLRYNPFVNKTVAKLIESYDYAMTQLLTVMRTVSWPLPFLERPADGPGSGDRGINLEMNEGEFTVLPPGAKVQNPGLTNTSDMRYLSDVVTQVRQQIDLHTLSAAAYGTAMAESGYQQNQLIAATETTLDAPARGLERGHEVGARLLLKCGRYLIEQGYGPIPVRYTSEEGTKYVTLDERLASMDWDIVCEVRAKPPGGESALVATLSQMKGQGWVSDAYAMNRLGIRNIERMRRQILEERITFSPELLQFVSEATMGEAKRALQNAQAPQIPREPLLTGALVANLRTEGALARLPPGVQGGAPPANAGMPGPVNPAPGPPTPSPATMRANNGANPLAPGGGGTPGTPFGQGQRFPGGLERFSEGIGR